MSEFWMNGTYYHPQLVLKMLSYMLCGGCKNQTGMFDSVIISKGCRARTVTGTKTCTNMYMFWHQSILSRTRSNLEESLLY